MLVTQGHQPKVEELTQSHVEVLTQGHVEVLTQGHVVKWVQPIAMSYIDTTWLLGTYTDGTLSFIVNYI